MSLQKLAAELLNNILPMDKVDRERYERSKKDVLVCEDLKSIKETVHDEDFEALQKEVSHKQWGTCFYEKENHWYCVVITPDKIMAICLPKKLAESHIVCVSFFFAYLSELQDLERAKKKATFLDELDWSHCESN